ncbi:MAG TPA: right-handed parallel beta-helix repeat-containing protein [Verrucomicrobiae bacterium]|nr:right-handed parallel beta-helix repeat-containing protein [Verrucomicrobiae bacterium]
MKTHRILNGPLAAATLLLTLVLHPASAPAQGSLTPPGSPAPTMKSLQEIEPRTIISSASYTITTPGSYYLSNNLAVTSGNAITIAASGVTLDLNGFTLSSTEASPAGYGIYVNDGLQNVTILNGNVQGGVTNNGSGVFGGPGFFCGIWANNVSNVRVTGVTVSGCLDYGIILNTGNSSVASECTVNSVGVYGFYANVVEHCAASDCGQYGIYGAQVSDSYGYSVSTNGYGLVADDASGCFGYGGFAGVYCSGTARGSYGDSSSGYGLYAYAAENCYGYCSAPSGSANHYAGVYADNAHNCYGYGIYYPGIQAAAANNCYGTSTYSYGIYGDASTFQGPVENSYGYSYYSYGIDALNANNCYGESENGDGLYASTADDCYGYSHAGYYGLSAATANNCYGEANATGGYGLNATCANNCYGAYYGTDNAGYGLSAVTANNCYGFSTSPSGIGLNCDTIAIGCSGEDFATSGTGLQSYIANSSYGFGTTPESINYKYNMP